MASNFEETYFDQLRAIERTIKNMAQQQDDLVDFQVDKALASLERVYTAELRGKQPPRLKLKAAEQALYDNLARVLDVYLGRVDEVPVAEQALDLEAAIACVKRIRRSVNQMRDKGRRGYIEFIDQFFAD